MNQESEPLFAGQYKILSEIDQTNNSQVYQAIDTFSGNKVALKLIELTAETFSMSNTECDLLLDVSHPFIIKCQRIFDIGNLRVIVFPLAEGGDLLSLANREKPISLHTLITIMKKCLYGIHYLHSLKILHGDVKPENILLRDMNEADPTPWITDFGYAVRLCDPKTLNLHHGQINGENVYLSKSSHHYYNDKGEIECCCKNGTTYYLPPEFYDYQSHSFPLDIYGLGMTFEVLTRNVIEPIPEEIKILIQAMTRPNHIFRPNSFLCVQISNTWGTPESLDFTKSQLKSPNLVINLRGRAKSAQQQAA
ncbi:hypothetical protein TRFO_31528 [Tritrichomonas foetus]|uniref:Protein kinase domain-containing protein n=1 Tax=Tritrichomonas foetus TaxID=1144522 RepID=A0A1J4JSA2_9EUKA|nr:hypothetical protein TRFO_31528 [Tritrichomonas foetus]|eukprot:OHT01642.1 hypothetical protein TRFO_31528 [Tritrichomonas foetus]